MAEMFLQASVLNTTDTTIYLVCMQLHFFRILPNIYHLLVEILQMNSKATPKYNTEFMFSGVCLSNILLCLYF